MTERILPSCQPHANLFFSKKFWRARPQPHRLDVCRSDLAHTGRVFYRDPFLTGDFLDALRWFFHRASAPRIPPSRLPGCPAPTNPPMRPRIDAISTTVNFPFRRISRSRSISCFRSLSVMAVIVVPFSECKPAAKEQEPCPGNDESDHRKDTHVSRPSFRRQTMRRSGHRWSRQRRGAACSRGSG